MASPQDWQGRPTDEKCRLVFQELPGRFEIAFRIRMGHAWAVFPFAVPLYRLGEIDRIFSGAGIQKRFLVRTQLESFRQALLVARVSPDRCQRVGIRSHDLCQGHIDLVTQLGASDFGAVPAIVLSVLMCVPIAVEHLRNLKRQQVWTIEDFLFEGSEFRVLY